MTKRALPAPETSEVNSMATPYKAPLRDMQFVMHELLEVEKHYAAIPAYAETNRELVDSVLEAGAQFLANFGLMAMSGRHEGAHRAAALGMM